MSGSTFGTFFRVTTWGESHGPAIGAVIDGCPAGLTLSEEDIQKHLDRRKPGQSRYTTKRKESDKVQILSGVFDGRTTGTPISFIVFNEDQHSRDYGNLATTYRPGHADYTFDQKYGFRDYRGGGRSSGRETIGRVAAGAVALKILESLHVQLTTYSSSIGPIHIPEEDMDFSVISENPLAMPNLDYAKKAADYLEQMMKDQDSCGGTIQCRINGLPAGIGEPVFDKLDANLAKAVMSIGSVKAVQIGDGIQVASSNGSQNNDAFYIEENQIVKKTNHAGGILGGISDGSEILLTASIKPTPSISQVQQTVTDQLEETELIIKGRHDPIIVPRAVVVVESMAALSLVDLLFQNMTSRMDNFVDFYLRGEP